jgi:hypothetical protein
MTTLNEMIKYTVCIYDKDMDLLGHGFLIGTNEIKDGDERCILVVPDHLVVLNRRLYLEGIIRTSTECRDTIFVAIKQIEYCKGTVDVRLIELTPIDEFTLSQNIAFATIWLRPDVGDDYKTVDVEDIAKEAVVELGQSVVLYQWFNGESRESWFNDSSQCQITAIVRVGHVAALHDLFLTEWRNCVKRGTLIFNRDKDSFLGMVYDYNDGFCRVIPAKEIATCVDIVDIKKDKIS